MTQYWKKPAGSWRGDLHVAVSGRFTFWLSRQPNPRGIAFENFEMRERFHDGQRFVLGITGRTQGELGFWNSTQSAAMSRNVAAGRQTAVLIPLLQSAEFCRRLPQNAPTRRAELHDAQILLDYRIMVLA